MTDVTVICSRARKGALFMDNNAQIMLAPGAGSGIGKMLADELLKDPEFVPLMRSVALGCLRAVTHRFVLEKKQTIEVPDFKIQAQMFFGLLAHMEGDPVKRIIHQHIDGAAIDPLAALQESPALLEAAKRMIDKAGYRTAGGERSKARAAERRAKQVEQPAVIEEEMG